MRLIHIIFLNLETSLNFPLSHFGQDQVPESDRCVVGGVQNSLQSIMDLLGYVMGIIISNPQVISCLLFTINPLHF